MEKSYCSATTMAQLKSLEYDNFSHSASPDHPAFPAKTIPYEEAQDTIGAEAGDLTSPGFNTAP